LTKKKTTTTKRFSIRFRYSFICQGTSTRRQWRTFSSFKANCHLLLPVLPLKGRGNPVKCLATQETCLLGFRIISFNAKRQAEKLWIPSSKCFDSTRESSQIYRLRGERS